jgi:DNA-binding LacI/PurR family transcriptional regulator
MVALQKSGIVPNRDIIIASHANSGSPVLQAYESDLILVEIDAGEIVQTMFDQLETLLRDEVLSESNVMIKPHLKVGEFVPADFSVARSL